MLFAFFYATFMAASLGSGQQTGQTQWRGSQSSRHGQVPSIPPFVSTKPVWDFSCGQAAGGLHNQPRWAFLFVLFLLPAHSINDNDNNV